jgi:hypothetical protein
MQREENGHMTEQTTFKNPFLSALGTDSGFLNNQALQAWTQAQSTLLEGTQTLIKGWLDRNRAAADATASAVQKLSESKDPAEMARIWADLASSQLQRATEGAGAAYEQYMAMWQQLADSARQACTPQALVGDSARPDEERPALKVRRAAS